MPPGPQRYDNEARFNQQNLCVCVCVCVCVCFDFEQENEKKVWASSFQSLGRYTFFNSGGKNKKLFGIFCFVSFFFAILILIK